MNRKLIAFVSVGFVFMVALFWMFPQLTFFSNLAIFVLLLWFVGDLVRQLESKQ